MTRPCLPSEHRRNLVDSQRCGLNGMVGHEFVIGSVRCRGDTPVRAVRDACSVYADRPILRPLVHRGGLRADFLQPGEIKVGDRIELIGERAEG